jgi:beta-phosphoglucomutase-like phosphatase (HAD superfamily)
MNAPRDAGLQARLVAALLEVSHLTAIATHPATRAELASLEQVLKQQDLSGQLPLEKIKDVEAVLADARHRLRAIHNAIASSGPHAEVQRAL